ncbi:MAG: NTP pyrophosphohydrolase [Gemmataceae bacterium]
MTDAHVTVADLKAQVAAFVDERDWHKFHSPKNLVMGLMVEAAELMEHFLWVDLEESRKMAQEAAKRQAIAEEMADVACYLLALANVLGVDLAQATLNKLRKNAEKYPVELYRGRYQ